MRYTGRQFRCAPLPPVSFIVMLQEGFLMTNPPSDEESDKQKQQDVLNTLNEAKNLGSRLSGKGRELVAAGQNVADWAEITKEAISLIDTQQGLVTINNSWKNTNIQMDLALNHLDQIDISVVSSTSTGSAITSLLTVPIIIGSEPGASGENFSDSPLAEHIAEQTRKAQDKEVVAELMIGLKLDSTRIGKRTPLEQLETAYKAFEITVDDSVPAVTSLIPLRECILQTIDILLKKRKHQEKASNSVDKVTSILRQLKRDSIPEQLMEELALQCKEILDRSLSPAKEAKIPRSQWRHYLVVSVLWLKGFLLAIDPMKMV